MVCSSKSQEVTLLNASKMLDKEGLPPDQHRLISQESSCIREDAVGLQHPDCDFVSLTQPLIEPDPMFD